MDRFVLAVDQGTTSTRAVLFDRAGSPVSRAQYEHAQVFPQPGWVEHDPLEIWENTRRAMGAAVEAAGVDRRSVAALGITNQRETVVVWNRLTGEPVHNAIVWQDTRGQGMIDLLAADGGVDRFRHRTGLPLAAYFSASKVAWILDSVPGARAAAERGELLAGTIDTWLVWQLTGGRDGGVHVTDATNASRTLLMDLADLSWGEELVEAFRIPRSMLAEIRSSSGVVSAIRSVEALRGVPIAGILGDQQAAAFGQAAFEPGDSKNTYGTGNFLLVNTGDQAIHSSSGLITTVAYRLGDEPPRFALEGSVAVTGSLVQWLRDNLALIRDAREVESLARTVDDNGGVYLVPAFSGLFAPHWRPDARGALVGLTRYAHRAHIARAALEATAFQTVEVIEAVVAETGRPMSELRVDGGMVGNTLLMQFQSDILGVPVVRPVVTETTALGAAYAAGLAVGVWADTQELAANWREDRRWYPDMPETRRAFLRTQWSKAVERTLDWV